MRLSNFKLLFWLCVYQYQRNSTYLSIQNQGSGLSWNYTKKDDQHLHCIIWIYIYIVLFVLFYVFRKKLCWYTKTFLGDGDKFQMDRITHFAEKGT